MAGLIAMVSVFLVVTVEMFFASQGAAHVHGIDYDELIRDVNPRDSRTENKQRGREEYIQLSNQDQCEPFPLAQGLYPADEFPL
jgi:hypothetical protein